MTLLLAAVGATVMAVMELTVGPYLRIGDAQPHLRPRPRNHRDGRGRISKLDSSGPSSVASSLTSSHSDHSGRPPSHSCSASAATAVIARLFARLRPIVPILATILVSLAYSMILFLAFNALRAPIPVPIADRTS